jgi:hypothetical protein
MPLPPPSRIPVIGFGGLNQPEQTGEISELSYKMGTALSAVFAAEPVRADHALEVLAIWAARIIKIHPSTEEYLNEYFITLIEKFTED